MWPLRHGNFLRDGKQGCFFVLVRRVSACNRNKMVSKSMITSFAATVLCLLCVDGLATGASLASAGLKPPAYNRNCWVNIMHVHDVAQYVTCAPQKVQS